MHLVFVLKGRVVYFFVQVKDLLTFSHPDLCYG